MSPEQDFIAADWPAPTHIRAGTTLRTGGVSRAPFDTFNLGLHTGDAAAAVETNRQRLSRALALPGSPVWLEQVHGNMIADLDAAHTGPADGAVATRGDRVAVVMTADCLPVAFCDQAGTCWGVAHAGWRGLAAGVLEATIAALPAAPRDLLAWMGPAIGPTAFEVGPDVYAAFTSHDNGCDQYFRPRPQQAGENKYLADIYGLARRRLRQAGLHHVSGGHWCTVSEPARFFSYRRDGQTGRMATLVWLDRLA